MDCRACHSAQMYPERVCVEALAPAGKAGLQPRAHARAEQPPWDALHELHAACCHCPRSMSIEVQPCTSIISAFQVAIEAIEVECKVMQLLVKPLMG